MKLYLLVRQPPREHRTRQDYDVAEGMLVAAKTEAQARELAKSSAGDEGIATWANPQASTCEEIAKRTHKLAGVLLVDFAAG